MVAGPTVETVVDRPAFRLEMSSTDGSQPLSQAAALIVRNLMVPKEVDAFTRRRQRGIQLRHPC
jgi:hypothetical protein